MTEPTQLLHLAVGLLAVWGFVGCYIVGGGGVARDHSHPRVEMTALGGSKA